MIKMVCDLRFSKNYRIILLIEM